MYEDKVCWISHGGSRILYIDYTDIPSNQVIDVINYSLGFFTKEPKNSVLYLVNVENLNFSPSILNQFNKHAANTRPYAKAGAMLGVKGLVKVMYDAFAKVSGQDTKIFNSKQDALEWLAAK